MIRREHDLEQEARRVILIDPFGGVVSQGNFTVMVDEVDANTTYIGMAQIGTATDAAGWQIKRISVSGTVTATQWADGTDEFTKVWDNRALYSYS